MTVRLRTRTPQNVLGPIKDATLVARHSNEDVKTIARDGSSSTMIAVEIGVAEELDEVVVVVDADKACHLLDDLRHFLHTKVVLHSSIRGLLLLDVVDAGVTVAGEVSLEGEAVVVGETMEGDNLNVVILVVDTNLNSQT